MSIHKFQVYKTISRPRVNKSLKWDFIKIILTKDQERSKRNEKKVRIRKSKYIELDRTCCYIGKFNIVLSLCKVLKVTFYFSKGFSEVTARKLVVAEAPWPLEVTVVCFLE